MTVFADCYLRKYSIYTEKTVSLNQRNISLIYGQSKNFFKSKKVLLIKKKKFLIQRNRFVYIEQNLYGSKKLSSIQRKFFFDRISKKLFSVCSIWLIQHRSVRSAKKLVYYTAD